MQKRVLPLVGVAVQLSTAVQVAATVAQKEADVAAFALPLGELRHKAVKTGRAALGLAHPAPHVVAELSPQPGLPRKDTPRDARLVLLAAQLKPTDKQLLSPDAPRQLFAHLPGQGCKEPLGSPPLTKEADAEPRHTEEPVNKEHEPPIKAVTLGPGLLLAMSRVVAATTRRLGPSLEITKQGTAQPHGPLLMSLAA